MSEDENKKLAVRNGFLFNAYLINNPKLIKKLIHSIVRMYKIRDGFFTIVNGYVDINADSNGSYPGLIVRTDYKKYAILYMENSEIDDETMIFLIKEFIYDKGERAPKSIDLDKFEISEEMFLEAKDKL